MRHLEEEELLGALETEVSHVRECADCRERMEQLRVASERFERASGALTEPAIDPRVRRAVLSYRPRTERRWTAYPLVAAATILLVASAALASPVREWIIHRLGGVDRPAPQVVQLPKRPPAPTETGMTVSFAAQDSVLTIIVRARQAAGSLELRSATTGAVSASIVAGAGGEELFVAPGTLRVLNSNASTARYQVSVPATLKVVRVSVGDGAVRVVRVGPGLRELIPIGPP